MSFSSPIHKDPTKICNPDGVRKYAFVTFLMRNDNYLPGALVLASGLKPWRAQADLVCMVTGSVSEGARRALSVLFDHVVEVDETVLPHDRRQERQDRPYLFTRFSALRLGEDGDLGFQYRKVVVLDSDVLPLRSYGHLFTLGTPAGIINERKSNCVTADPDGRFVVTEEVLSRGKWVWHERYDAVCPHGQPIPRDLTDRVRDDPSNMGVNACLWVLRPSMNEYLAIMDEVLHDPDTASRVRSWNWPEMQYATLRWSGQWKNVDLRFCSFNGYPALKVLFGVHYSGLKPWAIGRMDALRRFARFADFRCWYEEFQRAMKEHPELLSVARLKRMLEAIDSLTG